MQIMNATEEDKDELLALYHAMIGGPCEWSETYPDENTIAFDLKNEDLFVMKNDAGEIIATISIDHDDAVESLTCWHEDQAPSGELSRLCVRKDMQGQGIAKQMMNYAGDVLKNRGMKGIHILVREGHVVALSTYAKIGFRTVGECDLFDKHFICMEKEYDIEKLNPRKNPYAKRVKKQITINIDGDTIDFFKAKSEKCGIPYQTLINLYLSDCKEQNRELELKWN